MIQPIFGNFGTFDNPMALLILAGVVVLLFGGQKLAGFGKSAGEGLREFKKAIKDPDESDKADDAKKSEVSATKSDKE